ncbi:MAG: hypothetical protein OHK0029_08960 [Armatimonadaceae bacterium]
MPKWMYVTLCLIAPVLWGIFSAWLFDTFDQKRRAMRQQKNAEEDPMLSADMYEI